MAQFDKIVEDLNEGKRIGIEEKAQNTTKIFDVTASFVNLRRKIDGFIKWLEDRKNKKIEEINKKNKELDEAIERAERVAEKIKKIVE